MRRLVLCAILLATPTLAQQPQQQTPSQIAIQINNIIGQWAQSLEALQQQNAQLQARVKELEAKEKENAK